MAWRFVQATCHADPEGFRGFLQVWQLWQIVGGDSTRVPLPSSPDSSPLSPFLF
jgi:hypothetical protein